LKSARLERLENLKQRETLKGELICKFRDRFNHQRIGADEVSVASAAIQQEVGHFIDSAAPVTESNIARLEQRLLRHVHGSRPSAEGDVTASACSVSAYTIGSAVPSVASRLSCSSGQRSARGRPVGVGAPLLLAMPGSPLGRGPGASEIGSCRSSRGNGSRGASAPRPSTAAESGGGGGSSSSRTTTTNNVGNLAKSARERPRETSQPNRGGVNTARGATFEWSVLDRFAAQQHRQDQVRQRHRDQELQQRLRIDLDKQMADARLKKERELDQENQFHRMQLDDCSTWWEQEKAKEVAKQKQLEVERCERRAQMETDRERREQHQLREREEAQALIDVVNQDLAVDKRRAVQRWERCREQAQEALQVSSESSKIRQEAQKQVLQQEAESVEAYERLRERRNQQLREKRDKEHGRRQMLETQAAQRAALAQLEDANIMAKAAAHLAEKNQKVAQEEQESSRRLAEKKMMTQAYLREQIQEKHDTRTVDQERRRHQRSVQESDAKQYLEEEQRKAVEKRLLRMEHRAELERQMATRCLAKGPNKELMSDAEVQLNKQLLDRAVDEH